MKPAYIDSLVEEMGFPASHVIGPNVEGRFDAGRKEGSEMVWPFYFTFKVYGAHEIRVDLDELVGKDPEAVIKAITEVVQTMAAQVRERVQEWQTSWYDKEGNDA